MALFKAKDLLMDKETTHEFTYVGFVDQTTGQHYTLNITVKTSRKLIKQVMDIAEGCIEVTSFRTKKHNGDDMAHTTHIDHYGFVSKVLDRVYDMSSGDVVDEHSGEILLALMQKYPAFLQKFALDLLEFYRRGKEYVVQEEQNDEKN